MAERVVANIYDDTRALLNQIKEEYNFGSDDQAVRYLCLMFMDDERAKVIKQYLDAKVKRK